MKRQWSFSNECSRKEPLLTASLLFWFSIRVLVQEHFKRAGVFMNRSSQVVVKLMSLVGVAWLTCMPNVGAWGMLGESSTRCHLETWSLGMDDIWTCEMWVRAESTGTIPTNATGRHMARPCHFCGGTKFVCQCIGT
jgi:hypothetical protein